MLKRFHAMNRPNAQGVLPQSDSVSSVGELVQRGYVRSLQTNHEYRTMAKRNVLLTNRACTGSILPWVKEKNQPHGSNVGEVMPYPELWKANITSAEPSDA